MVEHIDRGTMTTSSTSTTTITTTAINTTSMEQALQHSIHKEIRFYTDEVKQTFRAKLAELEAQLDSAKREVSEVKAKLAERERKYFELKERSLNYRSTVKEWYEATVINNIDIISKAAASSSSNLVFEDKKEKKIVIKKKRKLLNSLSSIAADQDQGLANTGLGSKKLEKLVAARAAARSVDRRQSAFDSQEISSSSPSTLTNNIVNEPSMPIHSNRTDYNSLSSSMTHVKYDNESNIYPAVADRAGTPLVSNLGRDKEHLKTNPLDDGTDHRSIDKNNDEPSYKYHEVIRKKNERRSLQGRDCPSCRAFLDAVCKDCDGKDNGIFDRKELVQDCSRHRTKHEPDQTPSGFWELSFADSIAARGEDAAV